MRLAAPALAPVLASVLACCTLAAAANAAPPPAAPERWTEARAATWYATQPWLVGANYVPSDAINQLEMFQPETFNPALNDKELALAESAGMNTARVFLQDQLYTSDPTGFLKRLDVFLAIAARHHIRPMLVLFDSCWDPYPKLGPQHPPIPGVHNSGWVQSPGAHGISDPAYQPRLEAYVKGVVTAFGNDNRILAWDIWNEPDNDNQGSYNARELPHKAELVAALLPRAFAWARSVRPTQPLTSGVWQGDFTDPARMTPMTKIQLAESDIITFHNYGWPEEFERVVLELQSYHRPVLCTEYMARGAGSTFDGILPVAKVYNVGLINWGLVAGKTQTYLPWDSWQKPYVLSQPTVWFHEVFRQDDTPYRPREIELLRKYTGRGTSEPTP
jgi:hypothetical protein